MRWGGRRAQRLTRQVLRDMGTRCQMPRPDGTVCGKPATTADHIVPVSQGGELWSIDNLRPGCLDCQREQGADLGWRRAQRRRAEYPPPSRDW